MKKIRNILLLFLTAVLIGTLVYGLFFYKGTPIPTVAVQSAESSPTPVPTPSITVECATIYRVEAEIEEEEPMLVAFSDTIQVLVTEEQRKKIQDQVAALDAETTMLAKLVYREARGVPSMAQQAAVIWCVLNRVDSGQYSSDIAKVIKQPSQFAWENRTPVWDSLKDLAVDVVTRWLLEKEGFTDVGRTLPSNYLFFAGDGSKNWFRIEFEDEHHWKWSLTSPYES